MLGLIYLSPLHHWPEVGGLTAVRSRLLDDPLGREVGQLVEQDAQQVTHLLRRTGGTQRKLVI